MSKRIVSQDLGYNEGFNELVVTHPETEVTTLSASTAYVNNKKSSSQGVSTRFSRPWAITDLADASYFFALGAKINCGRQKDRNYNKQRPTTYFGWAPLRRTLLGLYFYYFLFVHVLPCFFANRRFFGAIEPAVFGRAARAWERA